MAESVQDAILEDYLFLSFRSPLVLTGLVEAAFRTGRQG